MPPTIESLLLGNPPPPEGIDLATTRNNNIPNEVAAPVSEYARARYRVFRAQFPTWQNRRSACGRYNCFGHVFAVRRSAIYEDSVVIDRILEEDGYTKLGLSLADTPCIGDIALYRSSNGSILHVGKVVRVPDDSDCIILSKWNDHYGEDCHGARDVPQNLTQNVAVEYWTDRNREDQ